MTCQHALYGDRESKTVSHRGQVLPGWFSGEAAVWTGGSAPRIVGPFEDVEKAMDWVEDHAPGAGIFPYYQCSV